MYQCGCWSPGYRNDSARSSPDDPVVDNDIALVELRQLGEKPNWQADLGAVQMLNSLTLWPKMTSSDV
jgi:hypothetical protein